MAFTAGAGNNLSNAVVLVERSGGCLRGEALVIVFVSVNDKVSAGRVECVPKRLDILSAAVNMARTEERVVPDRNGTHVTVRRQVRSKPRHLRRAGIAKDEMTMIASVEDDDVPGADIVAVIAL